MENNEETNEETSEVVTTIEKLASDFEIELLADKELVFADLLKAVEKEVVIRTLQKCDNCKSKAARQLKMKRTTLTMKLKTYE